ncbi:hypothetical protein MINS_05750 [Mycolicibacterium insubricum]|uniref:DUF1707 SHOCT-like domain-containing protein n=1 Tax=Mycolicibacterium insubricum TaxID=444597 RepID=UPI00138BEC89|nr:DUF1707 domain-containing protein [Mycolicibacterium insubricum]BBZ65146.1 hypothetical protein MINS_05750 [Mycolicibacterium insubricum]
MPTPRTRAKDSDRNNTCAVLDSALADGQLSGEEHRLRVTAATTATTLGDLQSLTDDLQTDNAPVQLPHLRTRPRVRPLPPGWGLRIGLAAVLVVFGVGLGWGMYGNSSSPLDFTTDPGEKPDGVTPIVLTPPRELHSLGGLTGMFEQMRKRFGDTNGYRLVVYPTNASLTRPDPTDQRRSLTVSYRGGWGDPSTTTRSSNDRLVDLGAFDYTGAIGILRGAPQSLGIDSADVKDRYLIVEPSADPSTPDAVVLSAYISTTFGSSGYIRFAPDGTVRGMYPPS